MKKIIFPAFIAISSLVMAQKSDNDLKTWYHKDFATTKVYGVNTQQAYKFLESKGLSPKKVTVAVIDSGVEVDHPGLKSVMWTNPNEIPNNGKDDDNNGYVDDIHGWNFLGGKSGDVQYDTLEVTRVVKKYKPIFEGADSSINKANQAKMPAEFAMYMKALESFNKNANKAQTEYNQIKLIADQMSSVVALLGGKPLTVENVKAIQPKDAQEARGQAILTQMANDPSMLGKPALEIEKILMEEVKGALEHYSSKALYQYNLDYDSRSIVGDNYDDINEKYYGNNNYEGPDAVHGTHVAGIIAGQPHGDESQYGVGSKVARIMTIRAVPDGDERDKDVANSIRYAVDNGAKIMNMSFGKSVSPNRAQVWEAMKYAESKGVLMVKAAGNENQDLGKNEYFPTNFHTMSDPMPFVNNMIVVGASTKDANALRAGFSNYNQKMVDVFAPGSEIWATVPDAKYQYLQGTSMASPVVAGAAAVLLAYMPELTPAQVIESLVRTVNRSELSTKLAANTTTRFNMISRSGGVIDLKKAAEYAYKNFFKGEKTTTKRVKKYSRSR